MNNVSNADGESTLVYIEPTGKGSGPALSIECCFCQGGRLVDPLRSLLQYILEQ